MRAIIWVLMLALSATGQEQRATDAARANDPVQAEVRVSSRPYVPPGATLHVESNLVQVGVVVRDAKGRAVSGLTRDDFRILDQGKDREISSFIVDTLAERAAASRALQEKAAQAKASPANAPAATRPRFVALFFDDFSTPAGDLLRTKAAGKRFVQDGLNAGDRAAVFTTSGGRAIEYTADKAQLATAIDRVQAHPRFSENGLGACPRITPYDAFLIANNIGEHIIQLKLDELRLCGATPANAVGAGNVNSPLPKQFDPRRNQVVTQAEQTWGQVKIASQATLDSLGGAVNDLSRQQGTRTLLLVSAGFLAGTLWQERDRVIDDALHAEVVINSLDAKGLFVEAPVRPFTADPAAGPALPPTTFAWEAMTAVAAKEAPSEVLGDLAAATGGLFFHHNNDYSFGFRELGAVPETTYMMGFRTGEAEADGKYHTLKVRWSAGAAATHGSHVIEARPGYFASPRLAPSAPSAAQPTGSPRSRLDSHVSPTDASAAEFPMDVAVKLGARQAGGATRLDVQFHVETANLQFPRKDDRHTQRFTLVAALFDAEGKLIAAKEGTMELALKDESFARFNQTGVNASLTLSAPAGAYHVRAVVQDGVENKIAASTYSVQVP
jgi:VWFA-related protein